MDDEYLIVNPNILKDVQKLVNEFGSYYEFHNWIKGLVIAICEHNFDLETEMNLLQETLRDMVYYKLPELTDAQWLFICCSVICLMS